MAGQRLARPDRRAQLLDVAAGLVRAEGTDALTLARVAEAAGVTKPIVYGHFDTRTGLLAALYERVDRQQAEATAAALDAHARTLAEAATILAEAYIGCVLHIGQEYGGITAAVLASAELSGLLEDGRRRYAAAFRSAVERFTDAPVPDGDVVLLGVIGAAETLAREAASGRVPRATAVTALARLITAAAA